MDVSAGWRQGLVVCTAALILNGLQVESLYARTDLLVISADVFAGDTDTRIHINGAGRFFNDLNQFGQAAMVVKGDNGTTQDVSDDRESLLFWNGNDVDVLYSTDFVVPTDESRTYRSFGQIRLAPEGGVLSFTGQFNDVAANIPHGLFVNILDEVGSPLAIQATATYRQAPQDYPDLVYHGLSGGFRPNSQVMVFHNAEAGADAMNARRGLFVVVGSQIFPIVIEEQVDNSGSEVVTVFGYSGFNEAGQMVYFSETQAVDAPVVQGIHLVQVLPGTTDTPQNQYEVQTVVETAQSFGDSGYHFGELAIATTGGGDTNGNINSQGQVLFQARMIHATASDYVALFKYNGETIEELLRHDQVTGMVTPWFRHIYLDNTGGVNFTVERGGDSRFEAIGRIRPDESGQYHELIGVGQPVLPNAEETIAAVDHVLFSDNGIMTYRAAGNMVGGEFESGIYLLNAAAANPPRSAVIVHNQPLNPAGPQPFVPQAVNRHGQVLFHATLPEDGGRDGMALYTPLLHFDGIEASDWLSAENWTMGMIPSPLHDVIIHGPVILPSDALIGVNSLRLGLESDPAQMTLTANQSLGVRTSLFIDTHASLEVNGTSLLAGRLLNAGEFIANAELLSNVYNQGTMILPGTDAASTVAGDFEQQENGTLQVDLNRQEAGHLAVDGTATLAGSLVIHASQWPQSGTVELMTAQNLEGEFSAVRYTGPGETVVVNTVYRETAKGRHRVLLDFNGDESGEGPSGRDTQGADTGGGGGGGSIGWLLLWGLVWQGCCQLGRQNRGHMHVGLFRMQ